MANEVKECVLRLFKALEQSFHLSSASSTHGTEIIDSPATQMPTRGKDENQPPDHAVPSFKISSHTGFKANLAARVSLARHLRLSTWVTTSKGKTALSLPQDTQATFAMMSEEKAKDCEAEIEQLDEALTLRTAKGELVVHRAALIKTRLHCLPEGVWIMFYIVKKLPSSGSQAYLGAYECWVLGHLFKQCRMCEQKRSGKVKGNHGSSSKPAQATA